MSQLKIQTSREINVKGYKQFPEQLILREQVPFVTYLPCNQPSFVLGIKYFS
jgi:hypothetical protein